MIRAAEAIRRRTCWRHHAASFCGRLAMISSRSRWVMVTKSGAYDISMLRGRANGTIGIVDDAAGPRLHHADAVGEKAGLLQVVRDEQHGRLPRDPEVLHDRPQFLAGELIERAERLVQHQELRIVNQRAAERGALHHAAGQLPGILVAEAVEPDLLEQRVDAIAEFGLALGRDIPAGTAARSSAAASRCRGSSSTAAASDSGTPCRPASARRRPRGRRHRHSRSRPSAIR